MKISKKCGILLIFLYFLFTFFQFGIDEAQAWWNANYQYRKQITVTNNDSIQLTANTIVAFTEDTATLISNSKLRSDGKDWRIVYDSGTENEIAQLVEAGWNSSSTETWFRLQAAINSGQSDSNYYVYYGYSSESTSPSSFTTSETSLSTQTSGSGLSNEALDYDNSEYGGAQQVSIAAGTSRYWKITKFVPYVHAKCSWCFPCGNPNDFAAFIFTATNKKEGDQITNGKSDVVDADTFTTGDNNLPWSGDKPHIKTGTYYFAALPTNGAQRSASGCWFRWDYANGSGAYQVAQSGTWHTTDIGTGKVRRYKVYGREASNDDLAAVLGTEDTGTDTSPPTPNPMTFASAPGNDSATQISMTSTTGSDATTPVEYLFTFTACASNGGTGGTSSSWQQSTSYSDSGLQPNQCYGYTVTARDSVTPTPNTGTASSASETYTSANTPGTPTLSGATVSTLNLTNDANGNPSSNPTTSFAVQVT